MERRISAILAADVAEYTRLMEANEEGTHARLMHFRTAVIDPTVERSGGRVVKNTGDGFLATFETPLQATHCAITLQDALHVETNADPPDERIVLRIGINLCDTIFEANDIYGEGVNVAARLQAYAEPGGIVVSANVAEQIRPAIALPFTDLGELPLKNLKRPVRAFSIRWGGHPPTTTAPRVPDARPSIAVLPFRSYPPGDADYFTGGIVDDIIRALAGLKELFVISRASTLGYVGSELEASSIGHDLGVRYVLSGSVNRSRRMLRIATELSDTETGAIIWAERQDGKLSDLFGLQDRISARVVSTIAPHVRERELQRALRKHPDSMDAYDLVLQGIDLLYRMDYEAFSRARGLLQQAIAMAPGYAPAYAYAAQWHTFRVGQGWSEDPDLDGHEAARLASEAIARDKFDASALAILGHASSFLLKDYDRGRAFLERALVASPNNALAWNLSSCTYSYLGLGKTAIEHAEHSLRLSPLDPLDFFYLCNLGMAHYSNGTYAEAAEYCRQAMARRNSFRANLRVLTASLMALGLANEAREVANQLLKVQPRFRVSYYAPRCPFAAQETHALFLERLLAGGLPA